MKKVVLLVVFLLAAFSLFAQDESPLPPSREARIFIEPVAGTGIDGDYAYFDKRLEYEVVFQRYLLARNRRAGDFILKGAVMTLSEFERLSSGKEVVEITEASSYPSKPSPPVRNNATRREYFSQEGDTVLFIDSSGQDNASPVPQRQSAAGDKEHVFFLELVSAKTDEVLGGQYIVYNNIDTSLEELLSILTYNILSGIPEIEDVVDWRDKWLFVDFSVLWAPRLDYSQPGKINWMNLGFGISIEFQFLNFLALDFGAQVVQETSGGDSNRDFLLEAPVALKLVIKPLNNFVLGIYAGASYNYSLMKKTTPSMFSFFGGFEFGIRTKSGIFVFDPRVTVDAGKSKLGSGLEQQRYMLQFGIGYKAGFISKAGVKKLDY